jgi:hypothetical protein
MIGVVKDMDAADGETHPHATARVNGSKQREWILLRPMGISAAYAPHSWLANTLSKHSDCFEDILA